MENHADKAMMNSLLNDTNPTNEYYRQNEDGP